MKQVLFRGLCVRMSLATGICEEVAFNKTSKVRLSKSWTVSLWCC